MIQCDVNKTDPIYTIGDAVKMSGLPFWMIRELDTRGIIVPVRTSGNQRLYSDTDIERLKRAQFWVKTRGVNLAGVQALFEMEPRKTLYEELEKAMLFPSMDKLNEFESRYALVVLASKRAKMLRDGAQQLVKCESTHYLTIALEEIAQGKIKPIYKGATVDVGIIEEELPELPTDVVMTADGIGVSEPAVSLSEIAEPAQPVASGKQTLTTILGDSPAPVVEDSDTEEESSMNLADVVRELKKSEEADDTVIEPSDMDEVAPSVEAADVKTEVSEIESSEPDASDEIEIMDEDVDVTATDVVLTEEQK